MNSKWTSTLEAHCFTSTGYILADRRSKKKRMAPTHGSDLWDRADFVIHEEIVVRWKSARGCLRRGRLFSLVLLRFLTMPYAGVSSRATCMAPPCLTDRSPHYCTLAWHAWPARLHPRSLPPPVAGGHDAGAMPIRGYLSEQALECSGHRPPRSPPRKAHALQLPISKLLGAVCGFKQQKRNRRCMQRGVMDDGAFLEEEGDTIPRPVVRLPPVTDGSDAVAAALRNKRRRSHGGTPARPEDSGALRATQGSSSMGYELLQVLARAMLRRLVAERASMAAAVAEAQTGRARTTTPARRARLALLVAKATVAAEAMASAESEVSAATAMDAAVALISADRAVTALVTDKAH